MSTPPPQLFPESIYVDPPADLFFTLPLPEDPDHRPEIGQSCTLPCLLNMLKEEETKSFVQQSPIYCKPLTLILISPFSSSCLPVTYTGNPLQGHESPPLPLQNDTLSFFPRELVFFFLLVFITPHFQCCITTTTASGERYH